MPPLVLGFWVLIGFGGMAALWGPPHAWSGVDPTTHTQIGKPERGFYTAISVPPRVLARRNMYGRMECAAIVIAISQGQRIVRTEIDGVEQTLDWSWTHDVVASVDERRTVVVRYLDPIGGAELARHEKTFVCLSVLGEEE